MTLAVVPVKGLAEGKSRLLPRLAREEIEALALAMLEDVLEALDRTPSVSRRVVVTPDAEVERVALAAGAEALRIGEPGLNVSVDEAARALGPNASEPMLVVLGDVAGARAEDLEQLSRALEALGGRGAVLAPSDDGGSSALLRAPHDVIPSRFGPDSAKAHRRAAERAGVPFRELPLPSLAVDLDRPEDVERFLRTPPGGGRRTRALLDRLGWKASP